MENMLIKIVLRSIKNNIKIYMEIFYSSIFSMVGTFVSVNILQCVKSIDSLGYIGGSITGI